MRKTRSDVLSLILLLLLAASCASIQPPPGGPEDKTPPAVDTTTPYNRQTNVPVTTKLYFRFDRPVDRSSFIQALSITPYVNGVINYDWSGYDEVTVILPQPLRDSTTYTVTLGRELKSRRGNNLAQPQPLTFSTGPFIDTGALAGYVMNPISNYRVPANQVYVFAYDITLRNPDTLNLSLTPADLITQPGDQGAWQFLSMKVGHRYRVYATTDAYRNHTYDVGIDAYGIPASDVLLDSAVKKDFFIRLAPPKDTTRPFVTDVSVQDSFHVIIRFSEAVDSTTLHATYFQVSSGHVVGVVRPSPDKRPGQVNLLVDPPITPDATFRLTIVPDSIRDLAGNPLIDSAAGYQVVALSSVPAAAPPRFVSIGITDSVGSINPAIRIPIKFSDAVSHAIDSGISIADTSGKSIPIRFYWADDATLYVSGQDSLKSNAMYVLRMRTNDLRSSSSGLKSAAVDTTYTRHFHTLDLSTGGRLTGTIAIADSFFANYPRSVLVVQLLQNASVVREAVVPHGQTVFAFGQVPGDKYRIRAYLNKTGDNSYDPGDPQPWRFGVPTGDFPGDIDARPRWEIAKINFEVK